MTSNHNAELPKISPRNVSVLPQAKQANVWTPPKPDNQVFVGPAFEYRIEPRTEPLHPNTMKPRPIPNITVCNMCNANFETPIDLQVHLHVDHIRMMDGNEYKCPRLFCDKVFMDRDSLRRHMTLHYVNEQQRGYSDYEDPIFYRPVVAKSSTSVETVSPLSSTATSSTCQSPLNPPEPVRSNIVSVEIAEQVAEDQQQPSSSSSS
ncbi:unnamed protein product [Caenorhabditis angaria]|uniref:Fumarylacetoacetase n=1 Tax=Caenorhabditis angaria TaxID=860376 RepID=A0A9P1IZU6_9PELO|nr:unnamed protein product [Caenorhabditis angaria]